MTRETKIGLLVGLAFIIVIGILLSDHLTSSTEPQQAALTGAGNGVRGAVSSPGGAGSSAPVTVVPPPVTPGQQVATQRELTAPPVIVKIGGPTPGPVAKHDDPTPDQTKSDDTTPVKQPDQPVVTNDDSIKTPVKPVTPPTQSELEKIAAANGEPVVDPNAKEAADKTKPTEYTAQKNDSVSKIVAKYLGSSSKSNVDLFVKANPSLKGDPTKLQAGRTYQIPAAAAAKTAPLTPVVPDTTSHDADDAVATKPPTPAAPADVKPSADDSLYVVQPGDTLTKIAREQVGDVHAIAAIQDLNRDVIKGANKDVIYVGMKLRLPGKSVAKAD